MFKWKDYEENTALFIDGIDENVAILKVLSQKSH